MISLFAQAFKRGVHDLIALTEQREQKTESHCKFLCQKQHHCVSCLSKIKTKTALNCAYKFKSIVVGINNRDGLHVPKIRVTT